MSKVTFPSKMTKYEALLSLWNCTKALGLGRFHSHHQPTLEQAKSQLDQDNYVDYFFGKPIKTNFTTYPTLESYLYDRDAGKGIMQKVAEDVAETVGPTEKLNETEKNALFESAKKSIQIVDPSTLMDPTGSAMQMNVQQFDKVYLTDEWVKKAKEAGIPHSDQWFMVTEIKEEDNKKTYKIIGSMGGGGWELDWRLPRVIKKNLGFGF